MRNFFLALILCFGLLHSADVPAVVNQIDGSIIPRLYVAPCPGSMNGCAQTGINYGEGLNPPNPAGPYPIDAILDANTGPETFLIPSTNGTFATVKFSLLQEGAGYENIFGWYNVDTPNVHYPAIFSCYQGLSYEPPAYSGANLVGGFVATIDFQAEYAAGRYKGKQIGFYLVTPEFNATGSMCAADPNDQGTLTSGGPIDDDNSGSASDDANGLGRTYYTESKLNNDGNYVHYLIYKSKNFANTYYFGFEDKFRGNDNDFEDILVKVQGLIPTCQPSQEICNGVDDNCNNQIDENLFRSCSNACGAGQEQCSFSNDGNAANDWINCTAPAVGKETCNGLDDDCDGTPDNNLGTMPTCTLGNCPGHMACVAGILLCDAPKPSTEVCDGIDNDCDGKIDENITRPCVSACGFGSETCSFSNDGNADNDWINCTAPTSTTESCNGLDDDCDGIVDNHISGLDLPCAASGSQGTCAQGKIKCVGGQMTCVGATAGKTEVCDCIDNNCDGQIDENNPCPTGTACIECGCRISCAGSEFTCPRGFVCRQGYCLTDLCADVSCKDTERCVDGFCVDRCANVECLEGKVCDKGICVDNNCYGLGCPAGQKCLASQCVEDQCTTLTCAEGEYCKDGQCRPSCGPARCGVGEICIDGQCLPDLCANVKCSPNIDCHQGKCDTACLPNVLCGVGRTCRWGECVDDPCTGVHCYGANETCQVGQCITPETLNREKREILVAGHGGLNCQMSSNDIRPGSWFEVILFGGIILITTFWRRRRASISARPWCCLLALLFLGSGCATDPYVWINSGDNADQSDAGTIIVIPCTPTNNGVELCDGKDNDCDKQIDEDFNFLTNPEHCGSCNVSCQLTGAIATCELSKCKFVTCAPGYVDLNQSTLDGCEYECQNSGEEICDGKDNNCDGKIDEGFSLEQDVNNCGTCGNICKLANATVKCQQGKCEIFACHAGFINKDKTTDNGCEEACTVTNNGQEICDGLDNDCNGVVDDPQGQPINLTTDPLNCGACNVVCVIPNAESNCLAGQCVFASCKSPYVDADKNGQNGCECLPSGAEKCDGLDNDCNGKIDDNIAGYPGTCGIDTGECQRGTLTCKNGVDVCSGRILPSAEFCDGNDTDCNGQLDPPACLFSATGREKHIDQPAETTLGLSNSAQLSVANLGDRVVVAWIDRRSDTRSDLYGQVSTDGGKTWLSQDIAINAANNGNKMDPKLAFGGLDSASGKPRVYVAYERAATDVRSIFLMRSLDGGATWGSEVAVKKSASGDALFVQIAVVPAATSGGNDTVFVCWELIATSGAVAPNVYCQRSTDSGANFAASDVRVNATADDAFDPHLGADTNYLYVTWQQGTAIRAARASVGAALSFANETKLSNGVSQSPRLATDGSGRVAVVWEDLRSSLINIRANISTNSGQSWRSDGVRVDNDVVEGDSRHPQVAMRAASAGGRIFVVWDDTNRGKSDILINHSDDNGASFGLSSRRIDTSTAGASTSLYPAIALGQASTARSQNVYAAWEDYRNGTYRDIYFSISLDNGLTFNNSDYRINESTPAGQADAHHAFIAPATSRTAVLWLDNRALSSTGAITTGSNADVYSSYLE